jgi:hypothetical protein
MGFHGSEENETAHKNYPDQQGDGPACVEPGHLLCSHEITINQEGGHIDAETGDQTQGVHIGEDHLASLGDKDDDGEKRSVEEMDAVMGLSAIGGDEPVKTIPLCHPFDQLTGGYKGSIDGHDQS